MDFDNQIILYTVLKTHHSIIVQDILGDVILDLYDKQVLTKKEYHDIKYTVKKKDNIIVFLN